MTDDKNVVITLTEQEAATLGVFLVAGLQVGALHTRALNAIPELKDLADDGSNGFALACGLLALGGGFEKVRQQILSQTDQAHLRQLLTELHRSIVEKTNQEVEAQAAAPHNHKCSRCGCVWSHDPEGIKTSEDNDRAHSCPSCGLEQFDIYDGPDPALWINDGATVAKVPTVAC